MANRKSVTTNRMAPPMPATGVMLGSRSQGADGHLWEAVATASGHRWQRVVVATSQQQAAAQRPTAPATRAAPARAKAVRAKPAPVREDDGSDGFDDSDEGNYMPATATSPKRASSPSLSELKETAKAAGIVGYSRMSKSQLQALLR